MPREKRPELTAARLARASETDREVLSIALDVLQNYGGSNTPFEGLIFNLIHLYDGSPDPERVDEVVAEFHADFASMRRDAEAFMKRYPKLFALETKEAPTGVSRTRGAETNQIEREILENVRSVGPFLTSPSAYQNSPAPESFA